MRQSKAQVAVKWICSKALHLWMRPKTKHRQVASLVKVLPLKVFLVKLIKAQLMGLAKQHLQVQKPMEPI